jgi:conjugal transfer pilus assembly protein TraW
MSRTFVTLLAAALLAERAVADSTSMIPATDEGMRAIARSAGERRAPFEATPRPPRPAAPREPGGLLFVSRGMPKAELVAAIAAARADPTLTLVLRGVLPGETLAGAMRAWADLIGTRATPPAILIDPTLFRRHDIEAVPTLVDRASGQQLRGGLDLARLEHERLEGKRDGQTAHDLGRIGPTWPIAEPDLAQVLRSRAERLDLPGRAQAALARFWRQVPAVTLPPATTDRIRRIRPIARTSNDLLDDRGRLLLPARSELNPLDHLPLTARILVIDAQDTSELAWARQNRADSRATIHLIVNPDRQGGWKAWQALQDGLGAPAFLLDRHLADRLGVEATPSLIEAAGLELVISETALARSPKGDQAMTLNGDGSTLAPTRKPPMRFYDALNGHLTQLPPHTRPDTYLLEPPPPRVPPR